jgi:hypothetical protein
LEDDVSELTEVLEARRAACESWPEGANKTAMLAAIDEVIAEVREEGTASKFWLAN